MKNALNNKLKHLFKKQVTMLKISPQSLQKKFTLRQCILTENGDEKVKERVEKVKRIDKLVLDELESNI